jgi:hypothetical protein
VACLPRLHGVTRHDDEEARSGTVAVGERGGIAILTRGSHKHEPSLALEKRKSKSAGRELGERRFFSS